MAERHPFDPSRTPFFYWVMAFAVSIVVSLGSFGLYRIIAHQESITTLETWKELRSEDSRREIAILHQLRDEMVQVQYQLGVLRERVALLEKETIFHAAQLNYLIEWDKRQVKPDPELRHYPR